ncbi:MAG: hypothetical protein FWH19_00515 [Treponema sp.]|nr:hypothetical protein [Treponema sp.]
MNPSPMAALLPRTAALLILFYQIRLLAGDLADTAVFLTALLGALFTAVFLHRQRISSKGRLRAIRPAEALIVIALVPWAIRFFIALPRIFFPGVSDSAIVLDSLLLNFDRNSFSALLPFYWIALTTYFSQRSRSFLRADIIAAIAFFLVLFSIVPSSSIEAYRWPILMVGLFALVLFLQILSLALSAAPELKLRKKEGAFAAAAIFLLVFLAAALFLRPFQERAVERGGGLLEPRLFRFDFSQLTRLESEISMSDELVMIVKKDTYTYNNLLRRYTLSAYNHRQGFFRLDSVDEAAHPQRLPNRHTVFPVNEIDLYRVTEQEYYIVNFDPSAFIGMNMPVEVTPFETWDASSFNSAYAVISHTSEVMPFELIDAVQAPPSPETLGLSPEEYALYTDYGADEAIAAFARETVRGLTNYWEQTQSVYYRLKYSEYRYSLRPGIAPDGDQLKHFLFNSKRGYCTYYAVAFTLMLRSLGIPSRLAVGFFVDPSTEAFGYYPVRADMAHAWSEVWFPGYGWIEYDPTSQIMAEGEEFRFSQGTPPELFERLMKEILDNRSRLRVREGEDQESERGALAELGRNTIGFFARNWLFLSVLAILISFLSLRSWYLWLFWLHKNYRKKTICLWAHTRRRLALAGIKKSSADGEAEWAKAHNRRFDGLYALYLNAAAARFAPAYSLEDQLLMNEHYRAFSAEYSRALPAGRRLLAWLLPPLALLGGRKAATTLLILVFLFSLRPESLAQDSSPADLLFQNALAAQDAENWERAIELLNQGANMHPLDFRFPWSLGNLYFHRRLYHLAWDEYRRAERLIPWEPAMLLRLAHTAGYLNRNEASAEYLERLLLYVPDDREAIGSLAWMYFKLHRLPEGEQLLLNAMENLGDDMDFSMTLGTIYSGMFRYQEAKDSYLRAIYRAESFGDRLFAALAHYNLSILESRFYLYDLAFERSNASLEAMNRSSGRLARGELYLRRMELPLALSDLMEGYGIDSSPLSKLSLAEAYMIGGRLGEAVLYAEDCLGAGDQSWMLNYGIDPVRYYRDIHEILKMSYGGLSKAEAFACPANLKERIQSLFKRISYSFRSSVHTHLFRKYSFLAAEAFAPSRGIARHPATDVHLEALIKYYNAFEAYPRRALAYLAQARRFEEPLIPGSAPSYAFEQARLSGNRRSMEDMALVLAEFDPLWERDMIAGVYAELALNGNRSFRGNAAERLFAINRGAMLQQGIRLPVELRLSGDLAYMSGTIRRAVRMAGLEINGQSGARNPGRYTLSFALEGNGIYGELYDGGRGTVIWQQNLGPSAHYRGASWALGRALRDGIFDPF